MVDPLALALFPFDLKDRAIETIRDVSRYGVNKQINLSQIEHFRSFLSDTQSELETFERVFRNFHDVDDPEVEFSKLYLKQCFDQIKNLEKQLNDIQSKNESLAGKISPTSLEEWFENFKEHLEYLQKRLEKLGTSINNLHQLSQQESGHSTNRKDRFRVRYMIERNGGNVYLDFEDENSPESKLMLAIFDKESKTVSVVASGMGGVGKTCALRGVALHKDAKERFPDGILYMSLGVEAGPEKLVSSLAMFVREAGGHIKSKEVEQADDINSAVGCAAEWFQDRNCLFLIDDISCRKGIGLSISQVLARLATHEHSKVAFTTRDNMFDTDVPVAFKKRGSAQSVKILLCSAGLKATSEMTQEMSAMESVLKMADGLPIALNVIGKRAKYLLKTRRLNHDNIWSHVCRDYKQSDSLFSGLTFHDNKDGPVLNVLLASLDMIDIESSESTSRKIFAAFCILQKRQEVPLDVLERIWGLSADETNAQCEMLARFSMVEISTCQIGGQVKDCLVLHDLLHDVARHLANEEPGCVERTSRRVIHSYLLKCYDDKHEASAESVAQSSTSSYDIHANNFHDAFLAMTDDGFILGNIFRLLRIANLFELGIALLSDPRWLAKQMQECGWKQVDNDFVDMLTQFAEKEQSNSTDEIKTFLQMVRAALSQSERHILNSPSPGMISTQLYGRLYHYRNYIHVDVFLKNVEKHARGQWLKSYGAFLAPEPSSSKVLDIGNIHLVRYSGRFIDIVNHDIEKGKLRLSEYSEGDDVLTAGVREWTLPQGGWRDSIVGRNTICEDIGLSLDCQTLAVGIGSKVMVLEKSSTCSNSDHEDSCLPTTLGSWHSAEISTLTMNNDGSTIVAGDRKGRVTLWKKSEGDWKASTIGRHRKKVLAVSLNHGEKFVVSGSKDNTAVLSAWDGQSWSAKILQHSERVRCCAVSECGSLVVTGSGDFKIRVWSDETGEWKARVLQGEWEYVNAVNISKDNNLIVCGSYTKVGVFKAEEGEWSLNVLHGHLGNARKISIREDRQQIVSADGPDGTVRVWNVREGRWEYCDMEGHTNVVSSVVMTTNRVVSLDLDGCIVVWDFCDDAWTKKMLTLDDASSVRLSKDNNLLRVTNWKGDQICFIERDGKWEAETNADSSSVTWTYKSGWLEKDDWPTSLEGSIPDLSEVYEVSGGESFAVTMWSPPYFGIVRLLNSL